MENLNQTYETIFVTDVRVGEEANKALVEKFTKLIADNGEITSVNEWGKRRLAYPIKDTNEGYYVLVNFTAAGDFIAELDRLFNINEGILRSIIVRRDEITDAAKPAEIPANDYEEEVVEAEPAPVAEAAEAEAAEAPAEEAAE